MHTEKPVRKVLIFLQQLQDAVFANVEERAHFIFSKSVSSTKNRKKTVTLQNDESQMWAMVVRTRFLCT